MYVADTTAVHNVALVFAPDGRLYDVQPKVSLTPIELNPLGWTQASPATIHAISFEGADAQRFPGVKMGIGISLDAFEQKLGASPCAQPRDSGGVFDYFMACLDAKGVNLFLQPEFNDGTQQCMSWTDYGDACGTPQAQWQPATWMASAWQAVQGTGPAGFLFQNFRYAVNPFMVGNLFDVSGDGQSAIFARDDPRAVSYWYAGDSDPALYDHVDAYTTIADNRGLPYDGHKPGFLALSPWLVPESSANALFRDRTPALSPGDPASLRSCEKGLAPGSSVTPGAGVTKGGPCYENNYRSDALVADLFPTAVPSPPPQVLPNTAVFPARGWLLLAALLPVAGMAALLMARRGRGLHQD